jgi:hypothetical protein
MNGVDRHNKHEAQSRTDLLRCIPPFQKTLGNNEFIGCDGRHIFTSARAIRSWDEVK